MRNSDLVIWSFLSLEERLRNLPPETLEGLVWL